MAHGDIQHTTYNNYVHVHATGCVCSRTGCAADLAALGLEAEREAEAPSAGSRAADGRVLDAERRLEAHDELGQHLGRKPAIAVGVVGRPRLLELLDVVRRDEVGVEIAERGEVLEDDGHDLRHAHTVRSDDVGGALDDAHARGSVHGTCMCMWLLSELLTRLRKTNVPTIVKEMK